MRLPFTPYGLREILTGSAMCGVAAALCLATWPPLAAVPALAWLCLLGFFRDPPRPCRAGPDELLSPADGVVADVEVARPPAFLDGPALRIGVFMSLLDVHVNRSPAEGTVRFVQYCPGQFHDARSSLARERNEHNILGMELAGGRRVVVNQIAGLVARRIVCAARVGSRLRAGERFGMVKFGSRVELYVPLDDAPQALARVGQRVKAGRDVLVAYHEAHFARGTGPEAPLPRAPQGADSTGEFPPRKDLTGSRKGVE